MNSDRPSELLEALARACGVATDVHLLDGTYVQVSQETIVAALAAMGVRAANDDECFDSLIDLEDYVWRRPVPPVTVLRLGQSRQAPVHIPAGAAVSAVITLESGERRALFQAHTVAETRTVDAAELARVVFVIPDDLPLGWHVFEAACAGVVARGYVVVTPDRLELPAEIYHRRPWGLMTQLYSLRSRRSWGIGDLGDLADLCAVAKVRAGADFVLINPLHAGEVVPPLSPSPYLPSSRRFVHPMYIRVEDIPEVAYVPSQQRAVIEWEAERPRRKNGTDELLDRDEAWMAKRAALEQVFAAPRSPGREAQFETYCLSHGAALEDFATWAALSEAFGSEEWPAEFAHPRTPAVAAWREEHSERVLFHAWLQWIADEQSAHAQATARQAGMSIGVITDLAVGVHPQGADAWALQSVLATGMSVGAPPDAFNPAGQDWSQPPWQPRALEAAAYLPFRDVVRAAVQHAGAVRIDHILGMFRQWWIPRGKTSGEGTYVSFDHESLLGIVALEAHRAGAIVIGEDLGTVEPWVREYLVSRGILGTSVMWFERYNGGAFTHPEQYRAHTLATVTTHDLPTTAQMVACEQVQMRVDAGLVTDAEAAKAEAQHEIDALRWILAERGLLGPEPDGDDIMAAAHRLVLQSPAVLVGVAITDLVGDMRAQNLPGTFLEYPNWKMPLTDRNGEAVLLDDLFDHPRTQRLIAAIRSMRG